MGRRTTGNKKGDIVDNSHEAVIDAYGRAIYRGKFDEADAILAANLDLEERLKKVEKEAFARIAANDQREIREGRL